MLKFAANISLMFQEWSLLDRFAAAAEAGFSAVEIQFPYALAPGDLARARAGAGVEVVLINAPILAPEHPAGSGGRPEQRAAFRESFTRIRDYAGALGARQVNVLAGTRQAGDEPALCRHVLRDNLLAAHAALAPDGIGIRLEAINSHDVPGFLVDSLAAAHAVLAPLGEAALLQLDLYHVARMGLRLGEALAGWTLPIGHVQFADAPGRHEPGSGDLPLQADLDLLARRYAGWVAAEYIPSGATRDGLDWLPAWRRRYGAGSGA